MAELKRSDQLVAAAFAVSSVVAIYGNYTAPVCDIKADQPNHQTANDTRCAALVAGAVVSGVALISGTPGVFVIGGVTILIETWVRHFANYTKPSTDGTGQAW
jgi:hypothetical protein